MLGIVMLQAAKEKASAAADSASGLLQSAEDKAAGLYHSAADSVSGAYQAAAGEICLPLVGTIGLGVWCRGGFC